MNVNNLNWSVEYYESNSDECDSILSSLENYNSIPLMNTTPLQNLKDATLVRYQGMVQDMLNPEYYSPTYTVFNKTNNQTSVKSGKFRDVTYCQANEEVKETDFLPKERLVFFCVPLPGTNSWVNDKQKNQQTQTSEAFSSGHKREASDSDEEMETESCTEASQANNKKNKTGENNLSSSSHNNFYSNSKYFPLPGETGLPCIVKVYEEDEKSEIVLNDRIEVVGFLSLNPGLEANEDHANVEDKALHPPPSLVPRIHALTIKKLRHFNPLLKQVISYGDVAHLVESARSDLHLILTQMLFEDTVAADYLLCHLLSRIYIRNDCNVIGKFSLNLFNIKFKNFGTCLNEIMKMVVTNSHFVPLSTSLLNDTSFIPKKDYETSRLCSGVLQLCNDTHLILDETLMNEGQLNNAGCLNVAAVQRLFRDQEVQYDFGYYPVTYATNLSLLVLSEGKSMFEADIRLKVKPHHKVCSESALSESFEAVRLYLNDEVCNKIRIYLTAMRLRDFELGEEMVRKIGEDYVSMRQQDRQVNSNDLHTLLILSRLLALSHGRTALKPEDWSYALEMETERKLRMR